MLSNGITQFLEVEREEKKAKTSNFPSVIISHHVSAIEEEQRGA